ncbi:EF-P 5-aminopentanol modification-associated protein YfmF [Calorimonas adulescens]|uniref:Insulinase family protein n=1 Tax=Calorimonas adulescens TaxID=2606906 RepID=A0A5D8QBN6_9THEO|nr:pitrilysin family protein [Calorimonas adulescens]TZE81941.1 insulinase family protein [Calorimonas adulescens]
MNMDNAVNINDNFTLIIDRASHFKTITLNLYIMEQLGENVTKFALLPLVLKHGSRNLPTLRDIESRLDNMYGALFNIDVFKKGNIQLANYSLSVLNDRYADNRHLIDDALSFLNEVLFNVLVENNKFNQKYVEIDKDNIRKMIEARINDKRTYAIERCIELMCAGDPYAIYPLGIADDINNINEENLYSYYIDLFRRTRVVMVITGDIVSKDMVEKVKQILPINIPDRRVYFTGDLIKKTDELHFYSESMDVTQGKLSIGYTTETRPCDDDYFSLMLFNSILGGGPQSKLFNNVREKASLAYYASSRLERFKGILEIYCGIELEDYEKALEIIDKQVEELKAGNITDYEFEASKSELIHTFKSIFDSPNRRAGLYLGELLAGTNYGPEDYIRKISSLTREDVVEVGQKVNKNTVYFLKNK